MTKICRGCQLELSVDCFSKGTHSKDGLQYRCKACQKKRWDLLPKEKRRTYFLKFDANNRERRAEAARVRAENSPEAITSAQLKWHYGITLDEYNAMLAEQGGGCKICGKRPGNRRLHTDHDPRLPGNKAGVRGILCSNCNRMLGYSNDSPEILRAGALYLEHYVSLSVDVDGPSSVPRQ